MDTEEAYQRLLQHAFRFISYRHRSRKELREFLEKKAAKNTTYLPVVSPVFSRMEELGYADDTAFASWWLGARSRNNIKGRRVIEQELRAKGVDRSIIASIFSTTVEEGEDEYTLATKALGKRLARWQLLPALEFKKKCYEFLVRRGFSSAVARRLVDEYGRKAYNKGVEIDD